MKNIKKIIQERCGVNKIILVSENALLLLSVPFLRSIRGEGEDVFLLGEVVGASWGESSVNVILSDDDDYVTFESSLFGAECLNGWRAKSFAYEDVAKIKKMLEVPEKCAQKITVFSYK